MLGCGRSNRSRRLKKISDGGSLFLFVPPNGSKLWRFSCTFAGKQKTLAIGAYPAISLAEARAARDAAKVLLSKGVDPGEQKKLDAISAALARATTFEVVAAELLDKKKREGRTERTAEKLRWLYDLAKAHIGTRPIGEITALEILVALRAVETRGQLETAKRLRAVIGEVFRYGVATGRAMTDPTFALRGALTAPKVKHRAAIIDPKAFGGLLRAIDGFSGQPTTKAALQLMALLFPRPARCASPSGLSSISTQRSGPSPPPGRR
ncbi:protein of unknown function [Bosea lupini]|uniref:Core-binding (CB) domain-containing protein n=2 Tax=Bosea lupini TaxID=1036779 RepID=A0A1H7PWI5_9HYPH|nr:protein of unknown function [Bosea lupini]